MDRLTHERVNGIKTGYWTAAKKDELVERLAAYENTGLTPEEIVACKGAEYGCKAVFKSVPKHFSRYQKP